MGIIVSEQTTRTERELVPMDLHRAVCTNVIDLGSHKDEKYGKIKRLVRLTFELADVRDDFEVDGEMKNLPRLMGRQYTMSFNENATLRKHLQSWRKKQFTPEELAGFDISKLVGVPCMLNVEHYTGHDGKTYAGIGSITGLPGSMTAPTAEGEAYYYSIDDHGTDFPEAMPDFIKDKVMQSVEMAGRAPQAPVAAPPPPFPPVNAPVPQSASPQGYEPPEQAFEDVDDDLNGIPF